jgi:hypothetical protein
MTDVSSKNKNPKKGVIEKDVSVVISPVKNRVPKRTDADHLSADDEVPVDEDDQAAAAIVALSKGTS